jgi:hypothetical protein
VDVAVGVALAFEERERALVAERGPVVAREHDLDVREALDRVVDVAAPLEGVAHLGSAQGVQVVHRLVDDLGAAIRLLHRQVEGELRRRLGVRRVLEHERDAVDLERLRRSVDLVGRDREAGRPRERLLPESRVDVAARGDGQVASELIQRAPPHRRSGEDVLARHLLDEPPRRHDPHAVCGSVRQHRAHAAEVIDVAVREDHRHDRVAPEVLTRERGRRGRALDARQRVDHDPARLPADPRHVRDVVAAHLVDPVRHLEEPVDPVQLGLAPERGIHARGRVAVDEGEEPLAPDATVRPLDRHLGVARHEAAAGVFEVGLLAERKRRAEGGVRVGGPGRRRREAVLVGCGGL